MEEIKKPITNYPGYLVSNTGKVFSNRKSKDKEFLELRQSITAKGYKYVTLCNGIENRNWRVGRIVATEFLPKREGADFVNYKDGDKSNNHVDNLEWSDIKNITATRKKLKRYAIGENHYTKKKANGTYSPQIDQRIIAKSKRKIIITDDMFPILEFDGYYIKKNGEVFSTQRGGELRPLRCNASSSGYRAVRIKSNGGKIFIGVHRLLAIMFIPNPHSKPCINHIDGNKLNNSLENLEWATYQENTQHAYRIGLQVSELGEDKGSSKLTNKEVKEIKQILKTTTLSQKQIGNMFGVGSSAISSIKNGRTWGHLKQEEATI